MPDATLHFAGGTIRTLDDHRPLADSLIVDGARVASLEAPTEGIDRAIDLDGATLLPGFIDSHLHLALGGQSLLHLDLSTIRSRRAFESAIAERHRALPRDRWLLARGWNEDDFRQDGLPDRSWLAAAEERPVVCWRMDQHSCVVNDAVLRRLDLRADPPGGRIDRSADGRPTGLLRESAAWRLVQPLVPSLSDDEEREAVRAAQELLASLGLVAVGSMEYRAVLERSLLPQRERFPVRMRVTLLDRAWPLDPSLIAFAREFPNDPRLAVIGFKTFVDGTLGSRTARLLEDYADDPGNRGLLVELAESGDLLAWTRLVRDAGLSPSMHAIGDEAARLALDAIEATDAPGAPEVRIEHAQTLHPRDASRFAGRLASMQPLHKAFDARTAEERLGRERMDRFFPFRRLAAARATLAFGSDWPIVSADPIAGLAAAITGRDLDERVVRPEDNVDPAEALRAYTRGAARCLGLREHGALRRGGPADFVVLDRDPITLDWTRARPRVLATIVDGRTTFLAPDAPPTLARTGDEIGAGTLPRWTRDGGSAT